MRLIFFIYFLNYYEKTGDVNMQKLSLFLSSLFGIIKNVFDE